MQTRSEAAGVGPDRGSQQIRWQNPIREKLKLCLLSRDKAHRLKGLASLAAGVYREPADCTALMEL